MTRYDLLVLDTVDTTEYMKGELSDDGELHLNVIYVICILFDVTCYQSLTFPHT